MGRSSRASAERYAPAGGSCERSHPHGKAGPVLLPLGDLRGCGLWISGAGELCRCVREQAATRSVSGRALARISDEDAERAWPAGDVVQRSSALMPPTRATTSLILATSDDLAFLSTLADHPAVAPFLAVGSGDEDVLRGL
jgi:hypothetical protein